MDEKKIEPKTSEALLNAAIWEKDEKSKDYNPEYFCIFEQKHEWSTEWDRIFVTAEIIERRLAPAVGTYVVVYNWDFCEGETMIRNLHIFTAEEVEAILFKECDNNE